MEKAVVNCLTDCTALCCRRNQYYRVSFDFSKDEATMMSNAGMTLTPDSEFSGYYMNQDCVFLIENGCSLHNKPEQPECCRNNLAGGDLCLILRAQATGTGKRYSEVE